LLPDQAVETVGHTLPSCELIVGSVLLSGMFVSGGAVFVGFTLLHFRSGNRGQPPSRRRDISCGCFPSFAANRLTWGIVIRNMSLAGLALVTAYTDWRLQDNFGALHWQSVWRRIPTSDFIPTAMIACTPLTVAVIWATFGSIRDASLLERSAIRANGSGSARS
jgi:Methylamine utilisation protein MauE